MGKRWWRVKAVWPQEMLHPPHKGQCSRNSLTLLQGYFYRHFKRPLGTAILAFILTSSLSDITLLPSLPLLSQEECTMPAIAFIAVSQRDNSTLASAARYWLRQKVSALLPSLHKSCYFIWLWQTAFHTAIVAPFPQCQAPGNSYRACPLHCSTLSWVIRGVTSHLAHADFFSFH